MKVYLRLLKYLKPYLLRLTVAAFCMLVFAATNGFLAYLMGPAIKILFMPENAEEIKLLPFDMMTLPVEGMIVFIPLAIIVIAIIKGLSSYGNTYYMGYTGQKVIEDLRKKLYSHILRLPLDYFSTSSTGGLSSRLTNDISVLQKITTDTLSQAFKEIFAAIALAVVIFNMDWKLAFISLVVFPLTVYPAIKFGRRMKMASKKGYISMGALSAILHEAISGIRVVKAFGMEDYETDKFDKENKKLTGYAIKTIKIRSISTPLMETIGAVGFAMTIWYAAYRITNGSLKPEAFISFFAAIVMLYHPIKALNGVHLHIQQGISAAARVFEIIDKDIEPLKNGEKILAGLNDSIEFLDASFNYSEGARGTPTRFQRVPEHGSGKEVLKGLNLKVKKGERLAIVGMSGVGKTTLVNLIPRFYDLTGGCLMIDGVDAREFTLSSLRENISIVSQEVILFNDTVRNNIAYGGPLRAFQEVVDAAKSANAHGFISRLPNGYDTVVGERGVKLSGGERQRISIARAILKNAPILIMDEATSSLDSESEYEVERALKNLMENRTTFVIAHRLSTVKNADRIIVLSNGGISEMGSHEELLKEDGEYRRLYSLQFAGQF